MGRTESSIHRGDSKSSRVEDRGRDAEERAKRRRECMWRQERERGHERLKEKKIEELERKRIKAEEDERKRHKGRSNYESQSYSDSRSASPKTTNIKVFQSSGSKSVVMSQKCAQFFIEYFFCFKIFFVLKIFYSIFGN